MEKKYYTPESMEEIIDYILSEKHIYMLCDEETKKYIGLCFGRDKLFLGDLIYFIESNDKETDPQNKDKYLRSISPELYGIPYLTREDIEECGCSFLKEADGVMTFLVKKCESYNMELDFFLDKNKVYIGDNESYEDHKCWFNGTIKNKSELKRVLKMLNLE